MSNNPKFVIKDTGEEIDLDKLLDILKVDARYGTSRDLGDKRLPANPQCRCSPMQAMFCPYGHMLECHYPKTCNEAQCDHLARYE